MAIYKFTTWARRGGELNAEGGIHMRKISFFAGVAVLFLIGVGTWIGVGTRTSTSTLAGTVNPLALMVSAKDLPTSHYDHYQWY
jgi:hypothetical protein